MRKNALCLILFFIFTSVCVAQKDDYKKVEFFGGYSLNRIDFGAEADDIDDEFGSSRFFNGFETSLTGNVSRHVGLKFDLSGHYKNFEFNAPGVTNRATVNASLYNILGGIQIKNNSESGRVKPFVHALAGIGVAKASLNDSFCREVFGTTCPGDLQDRQTGFAAALGGGIDVKVNKSVSVRLVQVDYNPVRIQGDTTNNIRFSFGLVFH